MIKITWFGHSMWKYETAEITIVVDPFTDIGYPLPKNLKADLAISTHNHFDHNNFKLIRGKFKKIIDEGHYKYKDITVDAIQVWHDKNHGLDRGKNHLIKINMDNLNLLHCGDLGHIPDNYVIEKLGKIDLLFVPIGGVYTIDAKEAKKLTDILQPSIVFPMHYKTPVLDFQIDTPDKFLSLFDSEKIKYIDSNTVSVEKNNLPEFNIYMMNYD